MRQQRPRGETRPQRAFAQNENISFRNRRNGNSQRDNTVRRPDAPLHQTLSVPPINHRFRPVSPAFAFETERDATVIWKLIFPLVVAAPKNASRWGRRMSKGVAKFYDGPYACSSLGGPCLTSPGSGPGRRRTPTSSDSAMMESIAGRSADRTGLLGHSGGRRS
jgi:hypothetical protein